MMSAAVMASMAVMPAKAESLDSEMTAENAAQTGRSRAGEEPDRTGNEQGREIQDREGTDRAGNGQDRQGPGIAGNRQNTQKAGSETIQEIGPGIPQETTQETSREIGPGINQEAASKISRKISPGISRQVGPGIPQEESYQPGRQSQETGQAGTENEDWEQDPLTEAEYFAQGMALVEQFVMNGAGNPESGTAAEIGTAAETETAAGTRTIAEAGTATEVGTATGAGTTTGTTTETRTAAEISTGTAAGGEDNQDTDAEIPPKGPGFVKKKVTAEDSGWQKHVKKEYGPHCILLKKEEKEEDEQDDTLPYTEEDLDVLAHAICGEGQCCPDDEQLYIGSVILNRRAHGAYPNTIKDVVFQRGQYSCTRDGNYYREPTEANWRNARWLLENGSILPGNVVYQAGFRQGSGVYLQTRYHKYCYR